MSLDTATVCKIARLARLHVKEEDLAPLAGELGAILEFVQQLQSVETNNVSPMTSAVDVTLPLRVDHVTDGNMPDQVLGNAPRITEGFYVVPKVVD